MFFLGDRSSLPIGILCAEGADTSNRYPMVSIRSWQLTNASAILGVLGSAPPAAAADFGSIIAYAYAHHPALKAERENLSTAGASLTEAYTGFLPSAYA